MTRYCQICDEMVDAVERLYEMVCPVCGQPMELEVPDDEGDEDTDLEDDD